MAKNIHRFERAISPILATLLLVVIAVAAIVVTYAWVMVYMANTTNQAGARMNFDTATIDTATKNVTITVRNQGTDDVIIDKVYIEGKDFTIYTSLTSPTSIPKDRTLLITTIIAPSVQFTFTSGAWYEVKVAGPATYWKEPVKAT